MKNKYMPTDMLIKRNEKEVGEINNKYLELSKELLNKYGPEGAHEISKLLIELADEDLSNALKQSYETSNKGTTGL